MLTDRLRLATLLTVGALLPLGTTCTVSRRQHRADEVSQLDRGARTLKVHMRNGDLYVLDSWRVDEGARQVIGVGVRYDENRDVRGRGPLTAPLDEVALFETNGQAPHAPAVAAMTLVAVGSAALTAVCISSPKTCFGSCPTTYVKDGVNDTMVAAESFSASIAPAFAARDVDALYRAQPRGASVSLRITNEALETHVIRQADLLVAPRPPGGRVLATGDGRFWQATALLPPARCQADEGSCLAAVRAIDDQERASPSDPGDLAARETITLEFPAGGPGPQALVIEARQTFITTFLLYQALAYMGTQAGRYFAALERGDAQLRGRATRLHQLMGDIEVQTLDPTAPAGQGERWLRAGGFDETGPIARDLQIVPLPPGTDARRIRLRLTRGHWRIGHLALATLGRQVHPVRVRAAALTTSHGDAQAARDWLAGRRPALVTGPGDEHELRFDLPVTAGAERELFLDARGYYLEWMREPWLAEESRARLALLFTWPERALRDLAPAYKRLEPDIEALFWSSRYVRR
jgi:hypothetical protein